MKCENCLHYGVCTFARQYRGVNKCPDFADKDLYIKLPCKVGTKVLVNSDTWTYDVCFEPKTRLIAGEIVSIVKTKKQTLVKIKWRSGGDEALAINKYKRYPISAIGKTVFLTREDAEKKLEELKNECK